MSDREAPPGPGWHTWIGNPPTLSESARQHGYVELWRKSWKETITLSLGAIDPAMNVDGLWWRSLYLNQPTEQGREMGRRLAEWCDEALAGKSDSRCTTCAFRGGDHLANGSPETLMSALKSVLEGTMFWCHEHDRPCAGWRAMRVPKEQQRDVPWEHPHGR